MWKDPAVKKGHEKRSPGFEKDPQKQKTMQIEDEDADK